MTMAWAFLALAALSIASDSVSSQQFIYNSGFKIISQAVSPLKSLLDSVDLPIVPQIYQPNPQTSTRQQSKPATKSPKRKVKNKQRTTVYDPNSRAYPDSYVTENYAPAAGPDRSRQNSQFQHRRKSVKKNQDNGNYS
ncbi:hypothetical protein DAPPUDRAFT_242241 [Daphnia pulex]|uniref:Uncharacterized protein n=1 Tax=Daphnia pulex TaxID=6669 RepID=E9GG64_DAPPU|nr:hypothetical protein DAPPUDRAFT_242241 [Daphnia pulex]|eukprot:EFX81547.1 hypothetical protein DAPPUDRAFT_242241 [Daphnia pulex]